MPFTIEHDPTLGLIEIVYKGVITASDLQESTYKGLMLAKETGTKRGLVNALEMELGASICDFYNLPNLYTEQKVDRGSHLAIILPTSPKVAEALGFFETVCFNRGWTVQLFPDSQKAIDWLML